LTAKGGSIDGPGPAIADGMVYVCSGYGSWGGKSGNVLLAFSVDGK
jgi:polyvinyl alcohol dehydrogenase (cytochrome)